MTSVSTSLTSYRYSVRVPLTYPSLLHPHHYTADSPVFLARSRGVCRGLQATIEGNVQVTHGPGEAMELEMCAAARLRNLQHLQLIDKDK